METIILALPKEARPYRALGERIARARERAGYTQREAARLLHISEGYLPQIERGRRRADPAILRRMGELYRVSYEELAELAGYLPCSTGETVISVTRDADVAEVRRFVDYPGWLKRLLNDTADRMLRDMPVPESDHDHRAGTDPEQEGGTEHD